MSRPIFTSLSPNTERDDLLLAFKLIFSPRKWRIGSAIFELEQAFREFLGIPSVFAVASGRTALYALLSSLGFRKGDEVLLQAFTCVAVPGPVLWAGLKPVYVDCDDTFNLSAEDLARKITPRSKALIIQHTLGQPGDLDALLKVAREHHLFVIEDCAHALGARVHGKLVGTFGDASFFSFGRDKVISSVFGGIVAVRDPALAQKIASFRSSLALPPRGWVVQQLLHPLVLAVSKATYSFLSLGKAILELAKRLRVISKAVYSTEKRGGEPPFARWQMPNALAVIALHQFKKLDRFNTHRKKIAGMYRLSVGAQNFVSLPDTDPIFLRYSILVPDADDFRRKAARERLFLGDWYNTPIAPVGVDYAAVGYAAGDFPNAESFARRVVNLPTSIQTTPEDATRIVDFIKKNA